MTRRLFTLAALLSLVLCLATAALWVRSYGEGEMFSGWLARSAGFLVVDYSVCSYHGRLACLIKCDSYTNQDDYDLGVWFFRQNLTPHFLYEHGHLGWAEYPSPPSFGWERLLYGINNSGLGSQTSVTIPFWLMTILFALPPAFVAAGRVRHALRQHSRRCVVCGYDLRATPARCPECGAEPAKAKT